MLKFTVRAYEASGAFACGATLHCGTASDAVHRFSEMPLDGWRAELLSGSRVIATRDALGRTDVASPKDAGAAGGLIGADRMCAVAFAGCPDKPRDDRQA